MGKIRRYVTVAGTLAICSGWLLASGWAHAAELRGGHPVGARGESAALVAWVANAPAPTVSVIPAAGQVTEQQSFVVTVEVASAVGAPAPTGSVDLYAGSVKVSGALGAGGEAALTVPGGALAAGTDVLTASYRPDAASAVYYSVATGQAQVLVYPAPAYFSIAAPAITVARGAMTGNTVAVTVNPYRGFTGVVDLTAAVTGAPRVVHDLPRLSFGATNPVNIVGGAAGTAMLTITTTGSGLVAESGIPSAAGNGAGLAALVLMTWPVRRKRWMRHKWMRALHSVAVGVFSLWLMGCGVTGQQGGSAGTTPGIYTVTVTGSAVGVSSTGEFTVTVR